MDRAPACNWRRGGRRLRERLHGASGAVNGSLVPEAEVAAFSLRIGSCRPPQPSPPVRECLPHPTSSYSILLPPPPRPPLHHIHIHIPYPLLCSCLLASLLPSYLYFLSAGLASYHCDMTLWLLLPRPPPEMITYLRYLWAISLPCFQ